MVISKYPVGQSQHVAETYASTHVDYPDFVKKLYDLGTLKDGKTENWVLFEIPDENYVEGSMFVSKRYYNVAIAVPTFTYDLITLYSDTEIMKVFM
ncbi:MAG TPA: hypothetical protein VKK79_09915 [Candidatus Lokiarchaeia archaeon]|nr:hypothetical protein [Candidatus Lokiarchaeia archaeon]